MYALGLVESGVRLDIALSAHLQSNHYPPISEAFIPVAKAAIKHAENGDWDVELEYPNGLVRTVAHTVEGLHLDAFIQS
jgi:hypothetical protein